MSRKRLVMKPITDLWWRYCRTNRENHFKRLSVNLCADSRNSGEGTLYFTIAHFVC
jgi:hypothetical protein